MSRLASIARKRRSRACLPVILAAIASSLLSASGVAATWHVPGDAPTIQAGIDAASAGDDVLVAPGVYWEHDIMMKADVWVHSEQGAVTTTINVSGAGPGFVCSDLDGTATIEGFTILNGSSHGVGDDPYGGGIRCSRSTVVIRGCRISGCDAGWGGGIAVLQGSAEITDCKVYGCSAGNGGGGIHVWTIHPVRIADCVIQDNQAQSGGGISGGSYDLQIVRCRIVRNVASYGYGGGILLGGGGQFEIRDSVIAGNEAWEWAQGSGLCLVTSTGLIVGCTIVRNLSFPSANSIMVDHSEVEIARSAIALNGGAATRCDDSQVTFACCDSYGNTESDDLCGEDLGGNFSEDPLFCDAEHGDYTLDALSPCLPGNHPNGVDCGLIGALGQGCGVFQTGACCFPDAACSVLTQSECAEQEGVYQGDGSACEPNPCQPTVVEGTTWGRVRAAFR